MSAVPRTVQRHGRHDLPSHPHPPDRLVRRLLAVRHWEGWSIRPQPEEDPQHRLIPDSVGDASQASQRPDQPRPLPTQRDRRGGRDVHWRARGRALGGSRARQEGPGRHRRRGARTPRHWPLPDEGDPGRIRSFAAPLCDGASHTWNPGDHRWMVGIHRAGEAGVCPRASQSAGGQASGRRSEPAPLSGSPCCLAYETMALWNAPGIRLDGALAQLPGRIRVPVQPENQ